MNAILLTTRQMSDHFGVTLRLLRFYEEKEILFPIREGNKRFFTKRDQARLKLVLMGRGYGFKLELMRHLLDLYDQGKEQQQLIEAYEAGLPQLEELKQSRWRLDETIADLELRLFECLERIDPENKEQYAAA